MDGRYTAVAQRGAPFLGVQGGVTADKRLIVAVSRAYYDGGTTLAGTQQTAETDADTYDHVVQQNGTSGLFGGAPLFKYNRAQLEYDF